MWRKIKLFGATSIVASVVLLAGCNDTNEGSKVNEERELPVKVATVTFGTLSESNQLTGTIVAENEVSVVPKAMGEITSILVKKGDYVKKGDIIAKLDDTAEQNAVKQQLITLEQAKTSLSSAENTKARAQSSYDQAQISLKSAQNSLEQAKKSLNDSLHNMDFQIDNAQSAWEQANKNVARMKVLYEDGIISLQEYENAVNAEKNAKNALDQVKLSKEQANNDFSLKTQEAAVEQAQISIDISKASMKDAEIAATQAQIQVDQAQIGLDSARDRLDDKIVKATISGEVTDVSGEVGEMASSANPFATIVSLDKVKLNVNISPNLLSSFKIGDSIEVKVAGLEKNVKGTVAYVSSVSSGYGLFQVEIKINNKEKSIKPGMVATAIVEEVKGDNSLIVPSDSIVQKEGKSVVYIVSDGKAVMKEVEVIQSGSQLSSVSGELKENEKVVISGQNLLEDGNKVQIMEEE